MIVVIQGYSSSNTDVHNCFETLKKYFLILSSRYKNLLHKARCYLILLVFFLIPISLPNYLTATLSTVKWFLHRDVLHFSPSYIIPPLEHLPWFPAITDLRTGADCFIWTIVLNRCCGGAALCGFAQFLSK